MGRREIQPLLSILFVKTLVHALVFYLLRLSTIQLCLSLRQYYPAECLTSFVTHFIMFLLKSWLRLFHQDPAEMPCPELQSLPSSLSHLKFKCILALIFLNSTIFHMFPQKMLSFFSCCSACSELPLRTPEQHGCISSSFQIHPQNLCLLWSLWCNCLALMF